MTLHWNIPTASAPDAPPKVATTVADLKKGVGSYATAVVAPKEGAIDVPSGTPVIVVAKKFWESKAVRRLWTAICAAWGAFWLYVISNVLMAGGPFNLTQDQWLVLLKDATYPALLSVGLAYGIQQKTKDNDPVVNGGPTTRSGK